MAYPLRRARALVLFGAIGALLVGSWPVAVGHAAPSAAGASINIAMISDINTMDPCLSSSFYDRQVLNNIMDKLFDLNSKGKIVPMLATGYKVSNRGLLYTITLRKGVKFQDGTTFNAAAVKFNLDRYRSSACAARASELAPVQKVTTSGAYTVQVRLSEAFSPLISILTDRSGMMASPKAVQSEGANFAQKPVGTGPFTLKDRIKGDHITLTRNAKYWRKGYPKASQVTFKIFTDANTQLVNLQSGQVDFMDSVSSQSVPTVQHNKALHLVEKPSYGWAGFWLNTRVAPLSNKLVRQAISACIDRAQYVKVIAGKTAIPADSPYGPGEFAYGSWDKAPKRNVKLGKSLLAKAKVKNPSFTFTTTTAPLSVQGAQIFQQMLAGCGFSMKIQTEDFTTILDALSKHNFEASAVGWSGRPDPDQNSYNHFLAFGANNYGQYINNSVNVWLNKARITNSLKTRKAYYAKVAKQLRTDVPYVFIDHPNNSFAMTAKLKGFGYVPDGIIRAVAMTK